MTKIISFVSQKGGTGKTTTALNLGGYLAAFGKYVLLIDLDPSANATSGLGFEPKSLKKNLYHVLIEKIKPEQIIKKTKIFGYELLPASFDLAQISTKLTGQPKKELKLAQIIKQIKTKYDYILIDPPPGLGLLTISSLITAEGIIIPIQAEHYALESLGNLLETIDFVCQKLNKNLKIMGALLTLYDRRNLLSRRILKEVQRHFPGYVFEAIIPRCVKLAEAPAHGQTILEYEPNSKGAKAYRELTKEIIELESKQQK